MIMVIHISRRCRIAIGCMGLQAGAQAGLGVILKDDVNAIGLRSRLESVFRLGSERIFYVTTIFTAADAVF